jgi:S-adenosylmethionine:tRNA ribosyltransferase-isomerase
MVRFSTRRLSSGEEPLRTDDLDFVLPPELIAQEPAAQRTASRLLHYQREGRRISNRQFAELPQLLRRGDLLVFNDARVVPARFSLLKPTGGQVEGLFLEQVDRDHWRVMLKNVGRPRPALPLRFTHAPEIALFAESKDAEGHYRVRVDPPSDASELLERVGRMPLPPYIRREKSADPRDSADRERYQTVYSQQSVAVAAPTAGLHFTPELLRQLDEAGVQRAFVTLHVGLGTFKPVTADTLAAHDMHVEAYSISAEAAQALSAAKQEKRRIIAVGTTSARVLESQPEGATFAARTSETGIFIYPPYRWKHVDALITNFHLPRSTLIALVAALTGLEEQRRIYHHAIGQRYRFFSYGDAMLVE